MWRYKGIVIFDLDGTLADISHRKHLVECPREEQDWDAFYDACDLDAPILPTLMMYEIVRERFETFIFSGRSMAVYDKTRKWLARYHITGPIRMRPKGDHTPDEILKLNWAKELGLHNIKAVFDDRDKVVKMWRENGITCYQVAPGNF